MDSSTGDVVIGYVPQDMTIVRYLADGIRKNGISVWHHDKNSKSSINDRIIHCTVFIMVLSDDSACDGCLQDQAALAYISNKAVVPVAVKRYREIVKNLTGGVKLMLAKINWIFFDKPENYDEGLTELCEEIRKTVAIVNSGNDMECPLGSQLTYSPQATCSTTVQLNQFAQSEAKQRDAEEESISNIKLSCDFWDRHFENLNPAPWIDFRDKFIQDYGERILRHYDDDIQRKFINLIYKDIFQLNKFISRHTYETFTGPNTSADPDLFYKRIEDYGIGYCAMREVFNMQSTVRLTAIANLCSFQTHSVIAMLFELIGDNDPNVRAIAALALAKTGRKLRKIDDQLINMLKDEDRLVRESACLSLAHMRCERATKHIVDRWRNDAIKQVRESAEVALKRMGSTEAQSAIHMTEVLMKEMLYLRAVHN